MPLTRAFKETVRARLASDPAYRRELLREGVECFLSGDLDTGKAILRDYINATIGFEALSAVTGKSPKGSQRIACSERSVTSCSAMTPTPATTVVASHARTSRRRNSM